LGLQYIRLFAYFGTGVTFQITGPGDLTQAGEITGGTLGNNNGEVYIAYLNFASQWSNNLHASGEFVLYDGGYQVEDLDVGTGLTTPTEVPEPASLALLSSGIAGVCAARRRVRI
jgi:hypothetical protein